MCGITGWIDFSRNLSLQVPVIQKMAETLSHRGPDDSGYFVGKNVLLGHKRLAVVDPRGGAQPMTRSLGDQTYTIVYNGELYNTEEVRRELMANGFQFQSYSDTEVLLTSYLFWGQDCLQHINGIFSFGIWDDHRKQLFLARDPLGVKPLFYSLLEDAIVFGSEIKALLAHPQIDAEVDENGLLALLSLGPARLPGNAILKGICDLPPAHFLLFSRDKYLVKEYWHLTGEWSSETYKTAVEHTQSLLVDAVKRQLTADVPVCTFLSGGLDSSAISAIAAQSFREKGRTLHTYSIDYEGNDHYFKGDFYQPDADRDWALKMSRSIQSIHHPVEVDNEALAAALYDAVLSNDLPGMADVDSSLMLFTREVRKDAVVALSGECADEVFGGYPWFTRHEDVYCNTFPWSKSMETRRSLLHPELARLKLTEYADNAYRSTISSVPHSEGETDYEHRMRNLFYLNLKWFMVTLLNRKDRMSMYNSLEVRVPFADYRLVEYAFSLPAEYKLHNGREKGLLRDALKGILPDDILLRKKSPYPKTHNPAYTAAVQKRMEEILADPASPLLQLLDKTALQQLCQTGANAIQSPWYGQLMRGPQLLAYLVQINMWLKVYKVSIAIG